MALVYVFTHEQVLRITSVHAKIKKVMMNEYAVNEWKLNILGNGKSNN